jgi:phage terminase large subunit-like protein
MSAGAEGVDDQDALDLKARLLAMPEEQRQSMLKSLPDQVQRTLNEVWTVWAHDGQKEPKSDWRVWLIRAGRGFGKTRAGAEWISQFARDHPGAHIALVGATAPDAARVMVEGPSGLMGVVKTGERLRWARVRGEVTFPSGAKAQVYAASAPETLRGPEHHAAWCDELAKWRKGDLAWDNLLLGLRAGDRPRVVVTTTPRTNALTRRVMRMKGKEETQGATRNNPHLPPVFVEEMEDQYGGTRLGRQELDGELIDDVAGALWTRDGIEACRSDKAIEPVRTVVAVDPPASTGGDACGIVAAAIDGDGIVHVLEDASVSGEAPDGWARAVSACADRHKADRVVAESNQGGDMVRAVLWVADKAMPVIKVHAGKSKSARAEPVAALYARGRVRHHGRFPALEDELCGMMAAGGYEGPGRSPDRADALVWAVTELVWGTKGEAAVRVLE